jgi:hypothetical protein
LVSLLGIDPMRIYIAQFLVVEILQKSVNGRLLMRLINISIFTILFTQEHDFDDEFMMTFSLS